MYELVLTREAQEFYEEADITLAERLNRCFDRLRESPYKHPNIKRLKGDLAGLLRYRVGDWRVVYEVDEAKKTVTILLIDHRSNVYD